MSVNRGSLHKHVLKTADRRSSVIVYWIARNVSWLFAHFYFRVQVLGRERLYTEGAAILAPVHRSNLDVPLISSYCRRRIRSMAKDSMFKGRFGLWLSTSIGAFPVRRGKLDRDALNSALEILRRKELLLVFPEGSRKSGPVVEKILDGCSYLATRSGAPVIPIGLAGTEEAMPPKAKFPRLSRIVIMVGEPVKASSACGVSDRSRAKEIRHDFSESLQTKLQALVDESRSIHAKDRKGWKLRHNQNRQTV